jgi:DnaJ-class molecular chaperone
MNMYDFNEFEKKQINSNFKLLKAVEVQQNERITSLEEEIKCLKELVKLQANAISFKGSLKHPHKCPACEGNGIKWDIHKDSLPWPDSKKIDCKSCEGKGILWV